MMYRDRVNEIGRAYAPQDLIARAREIASVTALYTYTGDTREDDLCVMIAAFLTLAPRMHSRTMTDGVPVADRRYHGNT